MGKSRLNARAKEELEFLMHPSISTSYAAHIATAIIAVFWWWAEFRISEVSAPTKMINEQ